MMLMMKMTMANQKSVEVIKVTGMGLTNIMALKFKCLIRNLTASQKVICLFKLTFNFKHRYWSFVLIVVTR